MSDGFLKNRFHIIIPARYHSTRLPGKVLLDIQGKPLIQRVYEQALRCEPVSVTIATDDHRIRDLAHHCNFSVCMTSTAHQTGTDRIAEAVEILQLEEEDIVVNLQGDEPLVPISAVHLAVSALEQHRNASVSTLCTSIQSMSQLLNPNVVKVVLNKMGFALYFSRSPIPYDRAAEKNIIKPCYFRHLGLYAYRVGTLKKFKSFEVPKMEQYEQLEQLRLLWEGEKIHVSMINEILPPGVDTLEDLENVRRFFETSSSLQV